MSIPSEPYTLPCDTRTASSSGILELLHHDRRGRTRPRLEEPAAMQERVEADLRHGGETYRGARTVTLVTQRSPDSGHHACKRCGSDRCPPRQDQDIRP